MRGINVWTATLRFCRWEATIYNALGEEFRKKIRAELLEQILDSAQFHGHALVGVPRSLGNGIEQTMTESDWSDEQ